MSETNVDANDPLASTPPEPAKKLNLDIDPAETSEWLESLEYVLNARGAERVKFSLPP